MREIKTQAVVLSTMDVFDADRLYLLFTRELGKIRARGKGVRRPTSRLGGHLLSFLPTEIAVVRQGEFFLIIQAHMLPGAAYPETALEFMQQAEQVAEALDKLVVDQEPHPELYDGLAYTLERLRETHAPELVTAEFFVKCLIALGYRPELEQSVIGEGVLDPENLGWNSEIGGAFTIPAGGMPQGSRRIQSAKTVVALRQFTRPEFVGERLGMGEEIQHEVLMIVRDYMQTIIGKPLKSLQ